jgi:hypothetical protein
MAPSFLSMDGVAWPAFPETCFLDNFRALTIYPESLRELVVDSDRRLLTNPDLSSHDLDQFLGIVADPGLEHRLDVLDLVDAL